MLVISVWCLHYVFLPRINFFLQEFVNQRNFMPLRTEHEATPTKLFALSMLSRRNASTTAASSFSKAFVIEHGQ